MSMIDAIPLLAGAGADGGYQISRSVRFRSSASAYLNRTLTTPTNNKIFTISAWVKRGLLSTSANHQILAGYVPATSFDGFFIGGSTREDKLVYLDNTAGYLISTQVFRDPSAWYHIMAAVDTTQATASNRVKLYVNGTQITSFSTANYPSLNQAVIFNSAVAHTLGSFGYNSTAYFDGYMTEFNFIDGQQLTPSSFGETNAVTGVWQPKKYGGTYGNNGFYLNFSDNSAATATTIGKDYSGNGNNWTPSAGISITAGVTYDSMLDVPTLYADGGNGRGNYATWNPLWRLGGSGYITPTNGNLRASIGSTNNIIASTIQLPSSGKWYMELTLTTGVYAEYGLCNSTASGGGTNGGVFGSYYNGVNQYAIGPGVISDGNQAWVTGDVGLIAVDVSNNKLWIGRIRSGTTVWMGGGNPSSGTSPSFSASGGGGVYATTFDAQTFNNPFVASGGGADVWDANFGQQPFIGTPPTGFKALNTQNLPTPTISKGNQYMDVVLYTGNAVQDRAITGFGFDLDLAWIKSRNNAGSHVLVNSVVGGDKQLFSNLTNAEQTNSDMTNGFTTGGILVGDNITGTGSTNQNTYTYALWGWNAGGSTVTNTSGSISAQVRANATAGFSVVTYTGTGANATVGHGLGVAPKFIIVKSRSVAGSNWPCYHVSTGNLGYNYLNLTLAVINNATYWNSTSPTSSVFSLGNDGANNQSSATFVAYCFASVAGYSAFGSYTGNGVADGVFVYLGFRPRFIMIKSTSASTEWVMIDTSRSSYNLSETSLYANRDYTESTIGTVNDIDILSNGFKLRNNTGFVNASQTYIYAAFSEVGFKYALGR